MIAGWLQSQLDANPAFRELSGDQIATLFSDEEIVRLLELWEAEKEHERFGRFHNVFPDEFHMVGTSVYYPRHLYPRHLEHFAAGAEYDQRCFMAGNRVGKTFAGAYETSCHLTGLYPHWWEGRRFDKPVRAWAAGKTNESTRDVVQLELLGEVTYDGASKTVDGAGMIPTDLIGRGRGQLTWKQGVADLIDTVKIKHKSGGYSKLGLKSYHQGRGAFEGTAQHVVWFDEEPPLDVYDEARMRTMTTGGIAYMTYTPLEGLSETVLAFLPAEMKPIEDQ